MAEESFNDLLRSLQAALDTAGARVALASAARSGAEDRSVTFMLPRSGGGKDAFDAVEIPLDSLRPSARLRIAGVSLDCECELARAGLFGVRRRTVVRIGSGRGTPGRTRRMRITLECGDSAQGEVRIDGLLLQNLPVQQDKARERPGPLRAAVARMLALLLPGRSPAGFVLTEEQSRRVERLCA